MKKIALFGGSFNPIHNSHVKLANYLIKRRIVDEVWIVPCKKHSFDKSLGKVKDRVAMIKLAINNGKIKICDIELKSRGKNYSINTLKKLKKKYPYEFMSIIGTDILSQIRKWHNYEKLREEAKFIVFKRKGFEFTDQGVKIEKEISYKQDNTSSSEIRERLRDGKRISNLVPKKVEEYLKRKKLYL